MSTRMVRITLSLILSAVATLALTTSRAGAQESAVNGRVVD